MTIILYFLLILILISIIYYLWYVTFSPQSGPVYVPSKDKDTKKMVEIANIKKGDVVFDLGSGDGRILIEAAKKGATAIGYEIDPILVFESRKKIKSAGVEDKVEIKLKNMWQANFNQADVIFVYLFPKFLGKLKKILEENLDHTVTVISNDYQIPNKKPDKKEGNIYLYKF
jgi:16S rRNA A1518/A1519 N6-dimethyltransferase RsmA/KsgA/DIM1 with predicted DNA glycosylase/AP lyase activity